MKNVVKKSSCVKRTIKRKHYAKFEIDKTILTCKIENGRMDEPTIIIKKFRFKKRVIWVFHFRDSKIQFNHVHTIHIYY